MELVFAGKQVARVVVIKENFSDGETFTLAIVLKARPVHKFCKSCTRGEKIFNQSSSEEISINIQHQEFDSIKV